MPRNHCVIFGSGLVSPPLFDYLYRHGHDIVIATINTSEAEGIVKRIQNRHNGGGSVKVVACDIMTEAGMSLAEELICQAKVACSLLPFTLHVPLAKLAIKHKTHFATASYVSPQMTALDSAFREAGLMSLNECGVDPGLDHMSARRVINRVRAEGGTVRSFVSLCGGLPSPESNNNPMGYKVSWSPRAVLLASLNDATFLENGSVVHKKKPVIKPHRHTFEGVGDFEWYENRDSTKYAEMYEIPECHTLIRGTFRNVGFHKLMKAIKMMGFLSTTNGADLGGQTYRELTKKQVMMGFSGKFTSVQPWVWKAFSDMGLFSKTEQVPKGTKTALDAFCHLFQKSCGYGAGEKDMILMQHLFEIERADGSMQQLRSSLVNYGLQPDGSSAMARTVSLPLAVATEMILKDSIPARGVVRPTSPEIYEPILNRMEDFGIVFEEEAKDVVVEPQKNYRKSIFRFPHRIFKRMIPSSKQVPTPLSA